MKMNCQLYERMALEFYKPGHRHHDHLFHGLREEVEEVIEAESLEDTLDELGDVLWYVTVIANKIGVGLDKVMMRNINKLELRNLSGKNS
jgi:NTP pyrophosphatase (non-canonical NTP hydrolase)